MSEDVQSYYDANAGREWERLLQPFQKLELVCTLHLIEHYFPATGRVADIGGGPGRYTLELIERGYTMALVDLSAGNIKIALDEIGKNAETITQGDARDLSMFEDESFDGALLLGPLYHLIGQEDRLVALRELRRILKPGGTAIAAYLNAWGIVRTGLHDFPGNYVNIDYVRELLDTTSFTAEETTFTDVTFATPPLALEEVSHAGFEVVSYAGVEGFAHGMVEEMDYLKENHAEAYENVLTVAAETCELPQYRDATDHLHIVVRKPTR